MILSYKIKGFSTSILLLAIFLLGACSQTSWTKIPEKKLDKILAELYSTESLTEGLSSGSLSQTERDSIKIDILARYGYTVTDLDSTLFQISQGKLNHLSEIVGRSLSIIRQKKEQLEIWNQLGIVDAPLSEDFSFTKEIRESTYALHKSQPIRLFFLAQQKAPYTLVESLPFSSPSALGLVLTGFLKIETPEKSNPLRIALSILRENGQIVETKTQELSSSGVFSLSCSLPNLQKGDVLSVVIYPQNPTNSTIYRISSLKIKKRSLASLNLESQTSEIDTPQEPTIKDLSQIGVEEEQISPVDEAEVEFY